MQNKKYIYIYTFYGLFNKSVFQNQLDLFVFSFNNNSNASIIIHMLLNFDLASCFLELGSYPVMGLSSLIPNLKFAM